MRVFDYLALALWSFMILVTIGNYLLIPKQLRPLAKVQITPIGFMIIFGIPLLIAYRLWG